MGEYQYRRNDNYVLPTAVYHQCIWMIRDIGRMESKISELNDQIIMSNLGSKRIRMLSEMNALPEELSLIEEKLDGIYSALEGIPDEYQNGLMDNIINHARYEDYAHENTWKKWKQRFIFNVAKNLKLY